MGFYERRVLPHILNCAMTNKDVERERQRCLAGIEADVLEIGCGSAPKFAGYLYRGVARHRS